MLDRESRCLCVVHFLVYRGLATRSRLPSYLFLILPDLLTILIRTHGQYHPPHGGSFCQLIPCSLTTRPASMSGIDDTLIAPWYTHPLHDTVPSFMSHLGSTPRYSEACPSPQACIAIASQHSLCRHVPTTASYPPVAICYSAYSVLPRRRPHTPLSRLFERTPAPGP